MTQPSLENAVLIFERAKFTFPVKIQTYVASKTIDASLDRNGIVSINGVTFPNLKEAMRHILNGKATTSTFWQFWNYFSTERSLWIPLEHLRAQVATYSEAQNLKTSDSHPLRIDLLRIPKYQGNLGLTFCPGKTCDGLYGGRWERDLNTDLKAIENWGAAGLISLMETHEFKQLGVAQFPEAMKQSSLSWWHLPIVDMQTPSSEFEQAWKLHGSTIHNKLRLGQNIVIHCRGGLGRTGLIAARILVETGVSPQESVAKVRAARLHSIETYSQEQYVLDQAWTK